jgi:hypothetical protein
MAFSVNYTLPGALVLLTCVAQDDQLMLVGRTCGRSLLQVSSLTSFGASAEQLRNKIVTQESHAARQQLQWWDAGQLGPLKYFGLCAIIAVATLFLMIYCFRSEAVNTRSEAPPPRSVTFERRIAAEPSSEDEDHSDDWVVGKMTMTKPKYTDEHEVYKEGRCRQHIIDNYGSWSLLVKILGALFQFWAALGFMYWSLLHRQNDLMNCNAYPQEERHSALVRHGCTYTYACLRGFPILAANMVLVLMIRILVQDRIYYSMLKERFVLDFAATPIYRTPWPWICGISMLQGACHFVLKMTFPFGNQSDSQLDVWSTEFITFSRKFVLPGSIFFGFLLRYADIENTLIPLNRIVEQEYTKDQRNCPWLAKLEAVNERVLAYDVRTRDVVGMTEDALGRAPSIDDIVENLLENYDAAHTLWGQRDHKAWGLFRSMWPAAVLVDYRLNRRDADTRAWLTVLAILATGCLGMASFSVYLLLGYNNNAVSSGWFAKGGTLDTKALLFDIVMAFHAIFILAFWGHTIRNMFFFYIHKAEQAAQGVAFDGSSSLAMGAFFSGIASERLERMSSDDSQILSNRAA